MKTATPTAVDVHRDGADLTAQRKRPDGEVPTTEGPTHGPKTTKSTGSSPGPTTPMGKEGAPQSSKKRANEMGQARANSTPASRPQKATPRASTAADTLASLADGAMGLDDYQKECQAAKAKRSRRGPGDHSPANPSPVQLQQQINPRS